MMMIIFLKKTRQTDGQTLVFDDGFDASSSANAKDGRVDG